MKPKINWKPYIVAAIVSFVLGVAIFCLIFLIFQKPLVDGFAFAAILLLSGAVLIWVAREGFFDLFAYGAKQVGSMFFSKNPRQYNDYPGYKEFKKEEREKRSKYFLSVGAVGLIFLIVTIIVYLVTKL